MTTNEFGTQLALAANNPTIRALYKLHTENRLILRPAFQRNLVWNAEQKSYLVDSILRNMPVPELYIQTSPSPDTDEEVTIVVDGQQRLSTCIAFYANELRLTGADLDERWQGKTISELDQELAERFKQYRLLVRELPILSDGDIREIFRRLNRVVEPLNSQELRHAAYSGSFIRLVESVSAHPSLNEFRTFTSRDVRRRRTDEFVSEVILAYTHKAFPNKKDGLDQAFKLYDTAGFPSELESVLKRSFGRVLMEIEQMSAELRRTRFKNKSDFYSLLVILLRNADKLPFTDQSRALAVEALQNLSESVARLRLIDPDSLLDAELTDEDRLAIQYLRAVEKAASDRLNRVRRDGVLESFLAAALQGSPAKALHSKDEAWLDELSKDTSDDDDLPEAEREVAASTLLED